MLKPAAISLVYFLSFVHSCGNILLYMMLSFFLLISLWRACLQHAARQQTRPQTAINKQAFMTEAEKAGWDLKGLSLGETKWRIDWSNNVHDD